MPNLITWISKNPHVKGGDDKPDVDYKKTFIWSRPPKIIIGYMQLNKDGSFTYSGEFSTVDARDGKPADKLDEDDKNQLLRRFNAEKAQADAAQQELKDEENKHKELKNKIGRSCWGTGQMRVALGMQAPNHFFAGESARLDATATFLSNKPDPVDIFAWDFGNGHHARGKNVQALFSSPGRYKITLDTVDAFGNIAEASRVVIVEPRAPRKTPQIPGLSVIGPVANISGSVLPALTTASGAQTFVPPVAGPQAMITGTVATEQSGPTGFYVVTVDERGKKSFYQGLTDAAQHFAFHLAAGVVLANVYRRSSADGTPVSGASCVVSRGPAQLAGTEQLARVPPNGPAIVAANSAYERGGSSGGLIQLLTRGTGANATVLADGSDRGVEMMASSDQSIVGRLRNDIALGLHTFAVRSSNGTSNAFEAIVATLIFEPLGQMRVGETHALRLHVMGPRPQDQPMVTISAGGAATLRGGATTVTVAVVNGLATVDFVTTGPGAVRFQARLSVKSPSF